MDATVVFMFINSKGAFFPGNWKIIPGLKSQNKAAAMRGGAQSFIVARDRFLRITHKAWMKEEEQEQVELDAKRKIKISTTKFWMLRSFYPSKGGNWNPIKFGIKIINHSL